MSISHSRRDFLKKSSIFLSWLTLSDFFYCTNPTLKKPNILILFTDDQRFDTIHALGNKKIKTPNMDYLAEQGIVFQNAYIMGGFHGAICMPSRAMLMTGKSLYRIPDSGATIPENFTMLPEMLQSNGYTTFGTGKWHNGTEAYARSFTTGAEIMFGGMGDHWNVLANDFDPTGRYDNIKPYIEDPYSENRIKRAHFDHITPGKHSSELFADATINFLKNRKRNRPFFAYVAFMAPHDPRTMPQEYRNMYNTEEIVLPPNFLPRHPFDNGELKIRDELLAKFPRTDQEVKEHIADYYSMISHLDSQIGRILEALRETGAADNTIIVLAGDNGLAVGQHGLMGKQNVYEHSVHVPLIIVGPGIPKTKTDALCYLIDIFPTLCDLTGIPVPVSVEGKSLIQVINGDNENHRDALVFAYKNFQRAIRNDRWKLISYNVKGKKTTQLFDLLEDPYEINDLSRDQNQTSRIKELFDTMQKLCTEAGDPARFSEPAWGVPVSTSWAPE